MTWLHASAIAAAILILILAMSEWAQADNWHWLTLCKHKTGEQLDRQVQYHGILTYGSGWVDLEDVNKMFPVPNTKCTLIEFRTGGRAVVIGEPEHLWCLAVGGPRCKDE